MSQCLLSFLHSTLLVVDVTRHMALIRRTLSSWDLRAITRYGAHKSRDMALSKDDSGLACGICDSYRFLSCDLLLSPSCPSRFCQSGHAFENLFEAAAENKRVCLADTRRYPNGPDESRQSYVLT